MVTMTFEELHHQCRRLIQLRTELLIRSEKRPLTASEVDLLEGLEIELNISETELVSCTPLSSIDIRLASMKKQVEELIGSNV